MSVTNLRIFRQFYRIYPAISQSISGFFKNNQIIHTSKQLRIHQSTTDESQLSIHQSTTDELIISVIEAIKSVNEVKHKTKKYGLPPNKLLASLSFTHLVELIKIEGNLKMR